MQPGGMNVRDADRERRRSKAAQGGAVTVKGEAAGNTGTSATDRAASQAALGTGAAGKQEKSVSAIPKQEAGEDMKSYMERVRKAREKVGNQADALEGRK